jgi:hypothetical protein
MPYMIYHMIDVTSGSKYLLTPNMYSAGQLEKLVAEEQVACLS